MFPFDAEVLASFYGRYNAEVWPAQVFSLALSLAAVWLSLAPRPLGGRVDGARAIGLVLVAGWLWCGVVFFIDHFARFDFLAPVYGGAFVVQSALLLWVLVWRQRPPASQPDGFGAAGLLLAFLAIIGLPLVSGLGDAGFAAARIVGIAPGPTVVLTLAMLLLVEGRPPWLLTVIPLLWCGVAAVTGWALALPEALAVALLGAVAAGLLLWKGWHTR